jgi:hypothetical protein
MYRAEFLWVDEDEQLVVEPFDIPPCTKLKAMGLSVIEAEARGTQRPCRIEATADGWFVLDVYGDVAVYVRTTKESKT